MAVAKAESPARKWLARNRDMFKTVDGYPTPDQRKGIFAQIEGGKFVGVLTPQGLLLTGRAVMKNGKGWVLSASGPDNQQAVANEQNTVYVAGAKVTCG